MASIYLSPHKKIIIIFSILVALALGGSVFGLFQTSYQATISIDPAPQEIDVNFKTTVTENQQEDTLTGKLFEIVKQGEKEAKAESTVSMKDYSEGKIKIINNNWSDLNFVAGTRFKSPNGLIYRAVNRIYVPSKGESQILVRADKMGKAYDIGPSVFTIPGLQSSQLKNNIEAKSESPMTGGLKESGIIMQTDITNAYNNLKKELYNQGIKEIENKVNSSDFQFAVNKEVIEQNTNVTPGDEKSKFKVSMKLKIQAVAIQEKDILKQAQNYLKDQIKLGQKIAAIEPSSLSYRLTDYNSKENNAKLEIQLRGYTTISKESSIIDKVKLKGQDLKEVENYLLSFKEIKSANIKIWPPFIEQALPSNPEKINIKILNIQ